MGFFELYRGEISGLLGALLFGVGMIVYRHASEEMDILSINLLRSILALLFFLSLTVVIQDISTILSLSRYIILMLALSVLFNVVLGDTAYFIAQNHIGVSKAFPITNLAPLLTVFFAHFLLGEPLTKILLVGVLLVMGGVYLITQSPKNGLDEPSEVSNRQIGYVFAFLTAFCWAFGFMTLRLAVGEDIDAISANSVRYAFAILFLFLLGSWKGSIRKVRTYRRQTIMVVAIATVFNVMLGSIFLVDSVKFAGASESSILFSTAPLFALPISVALLGESVSWKILMGTLMTIFGIWLVI